MIKEYICIAVDEGSCNGLMLRGEQCNHGRTHFLGFSCETSGCGKLGEQVGCSPINQEPDWEV